MNDFPLALSAFDLGAPACRCPAYLDPGMGSHAVQVVLAALFGGMFALKQSWSGVKVWYASVTVARSNRNPKENARPTNHGQSTAEIW